VLDITAPIAETSRRSPRSRLLGADMTVCILDGPASAQLIADARATGARIPADHRRADVAGAISASRPNSRVPTCWPGSGHPGGHHRRGRRSGAWAAPSRRNWRPATTRNAARLSTPLRPGPGVDDRRPGVRQQLFFCATGTDATCLKGVRYQPGAAHAVDRDAFEVGHRPDDRGLPPALEAQRILRHRLHRR